MTETVGRLIDHVHLIARDLDRAKSFYRATFAALGVPVGGDDDHALWADEFYLSGPVDATRGSTHVHLAFQAIDRAAVERWHAAGLAAGGTDNGAPGERPYHPGYYAAFLIDPDGNNVEAVHHGPALRSAAAITIESAR